MKSCLTVGLIILLVFVLLIGGLAWALRPPYPVIAPRETEAEFDVRTALSGYIMERVELALDNYSGEETLEVSLDQAGLNQVLADALNSQVSGLPSALRFTGAFTKFHEDYVQVGGGFKFLFLHAGLSARMKMHITDGNLELSLLSTHLGRLPLSANFVSNILGKILDLPQDLSAISVTAPIDIAEDMGIAISSLELRSEEILVCLEIDDDLVPEIPDSVVKSFEESLPQVNEVLADNPVAAETLAEIETLLEQAKTEDKQVNPLKLMTLGQKLYSSLSQEELEQLDQVLSDDVKELLVQVSGK
jgi:uncharacterized protein YpmS